MILSTFIEGKFITVLNVHPILMSVKAKRIGR